MSEINTEDLSVNYHDLTINEDVEVKDEPVEEETEHMEIDPSHLAILEGLLLVTGEDGLMAAQAAKAMEISEEEVNELLVSIAETYADDSHGFELQKYGETYRFLSKQCVHTAAKKLFGLEKEAKLSNAAMETLAIIAYKQPITRVEIEEIRGVSADVMLRKLEARGLIRENGRSDAPGRPFLYEVTEEFMNSFQLTSLEELPDLPQFNTDEKEDLFG